MRFGVTVHSARSWTWYEVAQGNDGEGPLKGISYDGILTRADGKVVIHALAKPTGLSGNRISAVMLLGHKRKLEWTQDKNGLTIVLPAQKPCDHAYAFKVTGKDLAPAR